MKRKGFTLAEVLITLGLIGVVAAMTLPGLIADTTAAQIGPKLAKAVSVFEQANEALLTASSVDSLSDAGLTTSVAGYASELSDYLKMSPFSYPTGVSQVASDPSGASASESEGLKFSDGVPYLSKDGMLYVITLRAETPNPLLPPHKQYIGVVYVDINGANRPNEYAVDIFKFALYNDGSLRPVGATNWLEGEDAAHWTDGCVSGQIPTNSATCTGSIFENNLKVLYK